MPQSSLRRPLAKFLTWYSHQLDRRPLLTKSISAGLIGASGDLVCQHLSLSSEASSSLPYDWHRTGRFFIMGSFWVAPITSHWYIALATKLVPGKTTVSTVTKRLVLDQLFFAPLFCPSFMGLLWLLEGLDLPTIWTKLREVTPTIIVANWFLWIPAMAVNFSRVPLKYQVLFGNVVALAWNIYLSYMSTRGSKETT
ncbi:Mpv17 / PMP22 family protein [Nitzschia inconspicua]|uniref:Mpv17 / PMP22 family protein n=1 Tax=Nitzschia inconspicua TaxID=303405 RepID=A0A9K3LVX0_9STRA|nr:Mpv17 / PMP22 family protein [Nitzschia inconspicua]